MLYKLDQQHSDLELNASKSTFSNWKLIKKGAVFSLYPILHLRLKNKCHSLWQFSITIGRGNIICHYLYYRWTQSQTEGMMLDNEHGKRKLPEL